MNVIVWLYHGLQWTWGGTPFRNPATGYNIVSGDLGDLFIVGFILSLYRKHNCHVRWCPFLSWHKHPKNGHPVCRVHHPRGDGLTKEECL